MPVTFETPTSTSRNKSDGGEVTLGDLKADNTPVDNNVDSITKMRQTKEVSARQNNNNNHLIDRMMNVDTVELELLSKTLVAEEFTETEHTLRITVIDHCAHGTHNLENELQLRGEPIVKSESVKSVNRTLTLQIILTVVFCAAEFTSGILCSSIAMLADSYHMAADVMALIVAFTCIKIATRVSTRLGYGWVRAETLGGFFNGIFMVTVCLMVFQEGTGRIINPQLIAYPLTIIIIGFLGLLINAVGIYLLGGHGHSHGGHGHSHGGGNHGHSHGKSNNKKNGHGHSHASGHGHSHNHTEEHCDDGHDHDDHKEQSNGKSRTGSHAGKSDALTRLLEQNDSEEHLERRLSGVTSQNAIIATVDRQMTPYGTHMASEVLNSSTVINRSETKSKKKKDKNVNLHGVWLHLLSDAFGSVIVIVSATVVYFWPTLWLAPYLDPGLSMCLASIMGFTAVVLVKTSAEKLLKKTPEDLDLEQVKSDLCMIAGVSKVEKLSVWTLCGDRIIAAAHVNFCHPAVFSEAAFKIKKYFHDLGVHSTTIEPTFEDTCMQSMKVMVKKMLNGKSIEEFTISTEDETIVEVPEATESTTN